MARDKRQQLVEQSQVIPGNERVVEPNTDTFVAGRRYREPPNESADGLGTAMQRRRAILIQPVAPRLGIDRKVNRYPVAREHVEHRVHGTGVGPVIVIMEEEPYLSGRLIENAPQRVKPVFHMTCCHGRLR